MTGTAPVDVYISIADSLLQVLPINQLGLKYIFTPFCLRQNQTCEKLFIYAGNDTAVLDICSDDFPETDFSNLVQSNITYKSSSANCYQMKLSTDNGLSFGCLTGISRLQITSNNPVGILHGFEPSLADNISELHMAKQHGGLKPWKSLPPVSAWGNIFIVVPSAHSLDILLTIIGKFYLILIWQSKEVKPGTDTFRYTSSPQHLRQRQV